MRSTSTVVQLEIEIDDADIGSIGVVGVRPSRSLVLALACAGAVDEANVIGIATNIIRTPSSLIANVITNGHVTLSPEQCQALTGQLALVIGAVYYLSPYKPGKLTRVKPVVPGQCIVEVGRALSMLTLRLEMKVFGQVPPWDPFRKVSFDPLLVGESPWLRSDGWTGVITSVREDGSAASGLPTGVSMFRLCGTSDHPDYSSADNQRPDGVMRVVALVGHDGGYGFDADTEDPWARSNGGIAQLVDGRFISWFSFVDVTGSGFHPGAIGGHAGIFVSETFRGVWLAALTEEEREQLTFATSGDEPDSIHVLHDRFLELGGNEPWNDGEGGDRSEQHRRHELVALAVKMGLFAGMEEARVDDLIRWWSAHYDMIHVAQRVAQRELYKTADS